MATLSNSQPSWPCRSFWWPCAVGVSLTGAALLGCTPQDLGPKRLPEPDLWRVPLPVFDAEQQQRKNEVDHYLALRYQEAGWSIIATLQTYEGDVIDWLDPLTVEGSQEEPPPLPLEEALPEGVEAQMMELEMFPELRGPSDTMPMLRPDYSAYILEPNGAASLEDWINNEQMTGAPLSAYRLYAGFISLVENTGASVSINPFGGPIEANTMSLLELGVGCRKNG